MSERLVYRLKAQIELMYPNNEEGIFITGILLDHKKQIAIKIQKDNKKYKYYFKNLRIGDTIEFTGKRYVDAYNHERYIANYLDIIDRPIVREFDQKFCIRYRVFED